MEGHIDRHAARKSEDGGNRPQNQEVRTDGKAVHRKIEGGVDLGVAGASRAQEAKLFAATGQPGRQFPRVRLDASNIGGAE